METNEIKNSENLRKLASRYFTTLKPADHKTKENVVEIKFQNYLELGCVITDMLKLCVLALNDDAPKLPDAKKSDEINVGLILETVLQMIPLDEFEFLSEINYKLMTDSQHVNE
ncbi:hypothetical protein [Flavobacterium sp. N2038]|uniref:hypothetical protein n=1 Tax=Flavobacterium sp. N2038 TaxID=2986829 RepID=UPI0022241EDD|nr:hypothetical protein [Flavobacterium sp. N2038]